MAEIALQNVTKRFGQSLAVDRVSLIVEDHEFLVILGPSGCGKSTTLRLIAGLETPDDGQIRIGSRDVTRVPPKDRDVAMVFQNYALYPHMTAYQNMAFGLRMRRTPKTDIERRVRMAAETLGISSLLQRKPGQLSGGERQRVAVGRAIVRDPAVFLFDEPLSNLDAKLRVAMRTELVKLQERLQTTMVYVTHDQVEAMMMGHRVAVMNRGRVLQIGSPQQVYHSPANRFVAEFIGSPPMNLWEATIRSDGDNIIFKLGTNDLSLPRAFWGQLSAAGNRGVIVGIRPEDVTVVSDGESTANSWRLSGTVSAVHALGPETILEVDCAPTAGILSARVGPRSDIARRDRVIVDIDPSKLHIFDRETGNRL